VVVVGAADAGLVVVRLLVALVALVAVVRQ